MDVVDVVVTIQQMKTLCPGPKSANMITRYPHLIPYADKWWDLYTIITNRP